MILSIINIISSFITLIFICIFIKKDSNRTIMFTDNLGNEFKFQKKDFPADAMELISDQLDFMRDQQYIITQQRSQLDILIDLVDKYISKAKEADKENEWSNYITFYFETKGQKRIELEELSKLISKYNSINKQYKAINIIIDNNTNKDKFGR